MIGRGGATPQRSVRTRMSRSAWVRVYVAMAAIVALLAVALPTIELIRPDGAKADTTVDAANGVTISVTANPATITAASTPVTFTYTLTNTGQQDLLLGGHKWDANFLSTPCTPLVPVTAPSSSGNGGNLKIYLPSGASATWTCTTSLSVTTLNTFTVSSLRRGGVTLPTLTASATVTRTGITPTCDQLWYATADGTPANYLGIAGTATPSGNIWPLAGSGSASLAVSPDGRAFYGVRGTSELRERDLATGADTSRGTNVAWNTNRLAVSPSGVLWSYPAGSTLYSWVPGSAQVATHALVSGPTDGSGDMTFDGLGNLWIVAGQAAPTLYAVPAAELVKSSQVQASVIGSLSGATGSFNGLAFAPNGDLYGSTPGNLYQVPLGAGAVTRRSALSLDVADLASCAAPKPTLTVTKQADTASTSGGGTVTYSVAVTNSGQLPAFGVTVADVLPAGATYVAGSTKLNTVVVADGPGGTFPFASAREVHDAASVPGVIPPNGTATVTFAVVAQPVQTQQTVCNQAIVNFSGGTAVTSQSACFVVEPPPPVLTPNISVSKVVVGAVTGPDPQGSYEVRYQLTVTNTGTADGTYGLVDSPQFDAGSTISTATWTGQSTGSAAGSGAPYTLAQPGTAIAKGVTHTYDLLISFTRDPASAASPCSGPGTGLYNAAILTAPSGDKAANACPGAPAPIARLAVTMVAGGLSGPDSTGLYTATYSVTVANSGNGNGTYGPLSNLAGFDPDVTITTATWAGPGGQSGQASGGAFDIGSPTTIAPGQTDGYTVTVTFRHTGGTVQPCTGSAGAGLHDSVTLPGADPSSASACLDPSTRFAVSKAVSAPQVTATYDAASKRYAATASYVLTVTNTGLAAAPAPELGETPTAPAGFTITGAALNGASVQLVSGSFTIPMGSTDLEAGETSQYSVDVVVEAQPSLPALDWTSARCASPAGSSGLQNVVSLGGDSDGAANNVACVTVKPPTADVSVYSYAENCGTQQPTCAVPGGAYEVYSTDPALGPGVGVPVPPNGTTTLIVGQTYWLLQTTAPSGFQLLPQAAEFMVLPATVDVAAPGLVTASPTLHQLEVLNVTKAELPKAGGGGPIRYGVAGFALFGLALVLGGRGRRPGRERAG